MPTSSTFTSSKGMIPKEYRVKNKIKRKETGLKRYITMMNKATTHDNVAQNRSRGTAHPHQSILKLYAINQQHTISVQFNANLRHHVTEPEPCTMTAFITVTIIEGLIVWTRNLNTEYQNNINVWLCIKMHRIIILKIINYINQSISK